MRRWFPAALLTVAALTLSSALPAAASTVSIPVPGADSLVAVDTSTKLVYVATTPLPPPDKADTMTSITGVSAVNPTTKKVVKAVTLAVSQSMAMAQYVVDVEVSAVSVNLWVLVHWYDIGDGCSSALYQLNKTTLATIRQYSLGCSDKIELDPTSQWAYLTEAPLYDDRGENAQPLTQGAVLTINGATGAIHRVSVPSPTTGITSEYERYQPTTIAFDRKNYGIYVVGQGRVWVYTTKLVLVHTTRLSYDVLASLTATANPTTNLIYVTDGRTVTEISGPTGNVTRTSVLGGNSTMVVDTSSNLLYLGANTVKLSTLRSTGSQPYPVGAVDPSTHARYWAQSEKLYITR